MYYNSEVLIVNIIIRPERVTDYSGIADMYFQAFADVFGPADFVSEVVLMDVYRHAPTYDPDMALVAEAEGKIAGHILYFPHPMMLGGKKIICTVLAIVGVLPELQKAGIGSKLVEAGMTIARQKGYDFSVVLGHDKYYPRFGYKTMMWGECAVKVNIKQINGRPDSLSVVPVRIEHVPALQQMWQVWHGQTDLAIVPGGSISEWSTHAKHFKAEVFLRGKDIVGYARYDKDSPQSPTVLLAKTQTDFQDVLAWLLAKAPDKAEAKLPVHPQSLVGRDWIQGEAVNEPWGPGMAMQLNDCPVAEDYLREVEEGKRSIGLMLWPALLSSAE